MIEQATAVIGFGPDALWVAMGVLIGAGIIAKLIMDLVLKSRELRRPKVSEEKTIQEKLASDHKRLSELEEVTKKQDKEMKLLLRSQMAMIHHMIDGNNTVALQKSQRDIEEFLIGEA
jgi:Mg2+/citrate symporter